MKKIAILGSTGSIGTQTLEIVREQGDLVVTALAAGDNIACWREQIREFRPKLGAYGTRAAQRNFGLRTADLKVEIALRYGRICSPWRQRRRVRFW